MYLISSVSIESSTEAREPQGLPEYKYSIYLFDGLETIIFTLKPAALWPVFFFSLILKTYKVYSVYSVYSFFF